MIEPRDSLGRIRRSGEWAIHLFFGTLVALELLFLAARLGLI